MSLAEKLVSLRKQKGLSQMELAEKLDVSRQAVSRWEVGTSVPSIDNLKTLGDLYGVPIDYLLNDETDAWCFEEQESNKSKNSEIKKKRNVLILVIAIVLVVIILFSTVMIRNWNQKQPIPMGEMEKTTENDQTTYTFSIG